MDGSRVRALGLVVTIAITTAAACGDEPDTVSAVTTTTTVATIDTTTVTTIAPKTVTTIAPTSEPTVPSTTRFERCLDFPLSNGPPIWSAETLLTSPDTGKRRIEGTITKTAAVLSRETVSNDAPAPQRGKPIYFVSINLNGQIITLAHSDQLNTGRPSSTGPWSALDMFSLQATAMPLNTDYLKSYFTTDGAQLSRDCVM